MAALGSALGALAAGNTLSAPQITVTALPTTVSVPIAPAVDRPLAALGFSLEFNASCQLQCRPGALHGGLRR
jgi:hypothetical protein